MSRLMHITPNRTYATRENAIKAVEKKYPATQDQELRYFVLSTDEGRYFPVFVGQKALNALVHFHFNVIA